MKAVLLRGEHGRRVAATLEVPRPAPETLLWIEPVEEPYIPGAELEVYAPSPIPLRFELVRVDFVRDLAVYREAL